MGGSLWYTDKDWAKKVFNDLINDIPKESIVKYTNGQNDMYITLINGTVINFVNASDNSRGCKFSKMYIQDTIDYEIYSKIIMYCNVYNCNNAIVLSENDDINNLWNPRYATKEYWVNKNK